MDGKIIFKKRKIEGCYFLFPGFKTNSDVLNSQFLQDSFVGFNIDGLYSCRDGSDVFGINNYTMRGSLYFKEDLKTFKVSKILKEYIKHIESDDITAKDRKFNLSLYGFCKKYRKEITPVEMDTPTISYTKLLSKCNISFICFQESNENIDEIIIRVDINGEIELDCTEENKKEFLEQIDSNIKNKRG